MNQKPNPGSGEPVEPGRVQSAEQTPPSRRAGHRPETIGCKHCHSEISSGTDLCPACGYRMTPKVSPIGARGFGATGHLGGTRASRFVAGTIELVGGLHVCIALGILGLEFGFVGSSLGHWLELEPWGFLFAMGTAPVLPIVLFTGVRHYRIAGAACLFLAGAVSGAGFLSQSAFADFLTPGVLAKIIMRDPGFLASVIRDAVIEMVMFPAPQIAAGVLLLRDSPPPFLKSSGFTF